MSPHAMARELQSILDDDTHIVNLMPGGYGLRHGMPCRTSGLLGCPVDVAMRTLRERPAAPGYYYVTVVDGRPVIGPVAPPELDPVRDRLVALQVAMLDPDPPLVAVGDVVNVEGMPFRMTGVSKGPDGWNLTAERVMD